jgi:GT2 family glycosyltransferase
MINEAQNPLVSIAIITWDRRQHVLKAIESVFRQPYRPIEVIVVDSASTDGTVKSINETYPEVRVIQLHKNLGAADGRNIALSNCHGDIIFSLDDDAWIWPSTLSLCVESFEKEQNLGVIACQILAPETEPNDVEERYTYLFGGGGFAIKKTVLDKTGYFPSDFFRQAEESDLALRVIEAGYPILFLPKAVVYHEKSPINRNSKLFMFYGCRNELFTVIRQYPLVVMPIACLWKIFIWNWAGIKNRALHFTLAGCLAALLKLPWLFSQRRPVSFKTIKILMAFKKNFFRGDGIEGIER